MQNIKAHLQIKIVISLILSIFSAAFLTYAYIEVPSGLSNAIQYISQIVLTDSGGSSGNPQIILNTNGNGGIFMATGSLNEGISFNDKFLALDNAGNLIYQAFIESWKQNGNDLYYDNGNIWIGTNSPNESLHVEGKTEISSGINSAYIYLSGNQIVIED